MKYAMPHFSSIRSRADGLRVQVEPVNPRITERTSILIRKSDIIVVGAIFGLLLVSAGSWIGNFSPRMASFFVLLTPLLLYCLLRILLRVPIFAATPQLIVTIEFTIFYWSGLWGIESGIPYLHTGTTDFDLILAHSLQLSVVTIALIVAIEAAAFRNGDVDAGREDSHRSPGRLFMVSQLLIAGSFIGVVQIVTSLGGFGTARAELLTHNKLVGVQLAGSLGASLWAICAVPAGLTTATLLMRRRELRLGSTGTIALASELTILLLGAILLFGGRLVPLTIAVGAAGAFYHTHARPLRARLLALIAFLGILVSFHIVKLRSYHADASFVTFSKLLSYNVFDVSMATLSSSGALGARIVSPDRWLGLLLSIFPFVGPSPTEISRYNLDFLIVQEIGTSIQARTTGFPPGLPTAVLLMTHSIFLAVLLAAIIGGLIGHLASWLTTRSSIAATVAYAFLMAFTFEVFKSGDLAATLAAYAKTGLYLSAAYIAASLLPFFRMPRGSGGTDIRQS